MKKIFFLLATFFLFTNCFASSGFFYLPKNAADIYLTLGKDVRISLMDLSVIKVKDFEKISGKRLNFFKKIEFKIAQRKLRKSIDQDGMVTKGKFLQFLEGGPATGFHAGGFFLGFYLSIFGVLIAYIIGGEDAVKKNRRKWAWIGFGGAVLLSIIFVFLILSSLRFYWH